MPVTRSVGQVRTTTGASVTVNVPEQITGTSHELVTVHVTVFDPPQANGAPVLLFSITALHPPVNVVAESQLAYAAFTDSWVGHGLIVRSDTQLSSIIGAEPTVNVELRMTSASHELVAVHVTVTLPPQAEGVVTASFVTNRLHPPLYVTPLSHVVNLVSMVSWLWQAASVTGSGAVKIIPGAPGTINVALQVFAVSQRLVTLHVTIVDPPQASGGPVLLLVNTALHPPVKLALTSQSL